MNKTAFVILAFCLTTASHATSLASATGLSLLGLLTNSQSNSEPDYTWLRLFGMWHDQFTSTGYALGAGAKLDPSPKVTLAIDAEIRLLRDNLSANSDVISEDMGLVIPLTLQYTLLGDHRSRWQPFLLGGGYYTASSPGGSEFGWLTGAGIAFNFGTEVLSLDFRYYSDTYVTDNSDTHHYAARLTLWFLKPQTKATTPVRSTPSGTSTTSGEASKKGKTRY